MATYMPAMRAQIGTTDYFVTILTLGEAARLIDYVEEVDAWTDQTPSELKIQRKLNTVRVERELVPYLLANDDHFYSALTVELRRPTRGKTEEGIAFESQSAFPGGIEFGMLTLDGTELLYALDGQHRLKSIELAIRQKPELAGEHIALIIVPFTDIRKSQTLFSDLNRNAKTPSKSVALLFSHRDPIARVAKVVADDCALLRGRVNMESTSLSSKSRHFMTLSTLYEMVKTLLSETPDEDIAGEAEQDLVCAVTRVFDLLADAVPGWRMVRDDEEHPAYLRQRELSAHGVGQRAIAEAVSRARSEREDEWEHLLARFSNSVDWRLTNPAWQGVALQGGRVSNTSTSIRLLADLLATALGLEPTENRTWRRPTAPQPVVGR